MLSTLELLVVSVVAGVAADLSLPSFQCAFASHSGCAMTQKEKGLLNLSVSKRFRWLKTLI